MIIGMQGGSWKARKNLEFAAVREKGNYSSHGRMKRQKSEGSESVNEKPKSHTCRNTTGQGKLWWARAGNGTG